MRKAPTTRLFAVALAGAALILSGCSTTVFDLKVGDCLVLPDDLDPSEGFELTTVKTVECNEPHQGEIVADQDVTDSDFPDVEAGAYPGEEALFEKSKDICLPAFESYVGTTFDESELDLLPLTPTQDSWNKADDRAIVCIAVNLNDEVTTTFKDSGR